jgi:hypothetical protein
MVQSSQLLSPKPTQRQGDLMAKEAFDLLEQVFWNLDFWITDEI